MGLGPCVGRWAHRMRTRVHCRCKVDEMDEADETPAQLATCFGCGEKTPAQLRGCAQGRHDVKGVSKPGGGGPTSARTRQLAG